MNFIIIANSWSDGEKNPTSKHHIARELARMGHCVLWVDGTGMRKPSLGSGRDRGRIWQKVRRAFKGIIKDSVDVASSLYVIAPVILPFPSFKLARRINTIIYISSISLALRKLDVREAVLINFLPVIPEVLKRWTWKSVYYCVDKWSAFSSYDNDLMAMLDYECCRNANVVIASARDLELNCLKYNKNTHLVLHGVDYETFSKAVNCCSARPSDLPDGPIIGFFGLLSEWLDQALLIRLARVTNAKVVLIGRSDVDISRLIAEKNIFLLGQKAYSELPVYLSFFDVGLIPFAVNDLTIAVNPLKLREMLAGGCRVVSTNLPEVKLLESDGGGRGIWVAESHEEFIAITKRLLEQPVSQADREKLSKTMSSETWAVKVKKIINCLSV